jgi:hypothetical protein
MPCSESKARLGCSVAEKSGHCSLVVIEGRCREDAALEFNWECYFIAGYCGDSNSRSELEKAFIFPKIRGFQVAGRVEMVSST